MADTNDNSSCSDDLARRAAQGDCSPAPEKDAAARAAGVPQPARRDGGEALRKLIVTGLGTGYLPIAPGTWGSLPICAIFLAVAFASGGRTVCVSGTMAVLAGLSCWACVALGRFAERTYGRKDPKPCVIDEWAGQAVTFLLLPLAASSGMLAAYDPRVRWLVVAGVGFLAFRLFDIIKPFPGRRLEKLPFGWGVLLDDVVAGVYANVLAQVVLRAGLGF